jgi:hypothetical protein
MAIKKKRATATIEIDLTGPGGNAWNLLAVAHRLSPQLGLDAEAVDAEMKSGDYENLIAVFDKHFGDYVTLYR